MGLPFTNLLASCCTSPSFVFSARLATPRMALGECHARSAKFWMSANIRTLVSAPFHKF